MTDDQGEHLVDVRFSISSQIDASKVCVVGEFNDWNPNVDNLERDDDTDEFVTIIALPQGRSYRYRYLIDDVRWENDWHAVAYVPNEFGSDDSVVSVAYDVETVAKQLREEVSANTDLPPITSGGNADDLIAPTTPPAPPLDAC